VTRDGGRAGENERRYGRCGCGNVATGPVGLCSSCMYGACTVCGNIANSPSGLCKTCTYGACKTCGSKANGPAGLCKTCTYGACKTCGSKANGPAGLCKTCKYAGQRPCAVPGCSGVNGARGGTSVRDLCDGHSWRLRTHGNTFPDVPIGHKIPDSWEQRPSVVYLALNILGTPIYIGSSFGDGTQRFAWHRKFQPWAREIAEFKIHSEHPTRGEAYVAEATLIKDWSSRYTLHNKVGTGRPNE
jgi:hypothetical protein